MEALLCFFPLNSRTKQVRMRRRLSRPKGWRALLGVAVIVLAAARADAGPVDKRSPGGACNVLRAVAVGRNNNAYNRNRFSRRARS